jgi:hypothetical protein
MKAAQAIAQPTVIPEMAVAVAAAAQAAETVGTAAVTPQAIGPMGPAGIPSSAQENPSF